MSLEPEFLTGLMGRLKSIDEEARSGGLDQAVGLMLAALDNDGVIQAFGSGHSQGFAMEIAGRAGGLIPTHAISLFDLALLGERDVEVMADGAELERSPVLVDELYDLYDIRPADVFIIASNSGVNGLIVGLALRAKAEGHPVIAVTSLAHTMRVVPKHPGGLRLSEVADVTIDNRAPYGDTTLPLGEGTRAGAVSSITGAYIAQLLTMGVAQRFVDRGQRPPLYISANIPGGDEHNCVLEARYGARIKPYEYRPTDRAN